MVNYESFINELSPSKSSKMTLPPIIEGYLKRFAKEVAPMIYDHLKKPSNGSQTKTIKTADLGERTTLDSIIKEYASENKDYPLNPGVPGLNNRSERAKKNSQIHGPFSDVLFDTIKDLEIDYAKSIVGEKGFCARFTSSKLELDIGVDKVLEPSEDKRVYLRLVGDVHNRQIQYQHMK